MIIFVSKHSLNFFRRDRTGTVFVKHFESSLKELVGVEVVAVDCGNDELSVVDEAGFVTVDRIEHVFNLFIRHYFTIMVQVSLFDLIHGEFTVSIFVEGLENFSKFFFLTL
jgi:hypothetical protein